MLTVPAHMQAEKAANIARFPALAIELTQEQIDNATPHQCTFTGLTSHQKAAIRIVAARNNWHPQYVAGSGGHHVRPGLFPAYSHMEDKQWVAHCEAWQVEHDMPVEALADLIEVDFLRNAHRLFEPLCTHEDGVIMSAHDDDRYRYPCSVVEW